MRGKKLRNRVVGLMLAGAMACPSAALTIVSPATVRAAQESAGSAKAAYQEIASGSQLERSSQLSIEDNQAVITVEAVTGGSFRTSIVDGDKYITTTTDGQSWYAAATGDSIYCVKGSVGENVIQGHIYEVRYTKNDSNYTIEYYDVSAKASLYTYYANNTNLTGNSVIVYAKAVQGTYRVYNCTAKEAGFSENDYSSSAQLYNHGRNRTRRVSAPDNNVPKGYDVNPATQGSAKDGAYDKYFLKDSLQEVKITINEDNLDYILQNASLKESALAESATIGDATVKNVGLKTKGNFTRDRTNETDSDRFSFTINFSKYIKKKDGYSETQNFFGCKKISFNNFYFDKTMMKEYNAFRLMTEMGLPTPQYGLAKLYINGEYYGVYFMVEAIDSSILEQYYKTSSKNLSSFLTKPFYYSPRYYSPDLDNCISSDGKITWEALVNNGHIIVNKDGSYSVGENLWYYAGLWENDNDTFQDVAQELPTVLTWLYRLTMLSNGKDFQGKNVDVNSQQYLDLLGQVMDVDETVKYFATHSFLVQMDNLFTWRQNYGLYVSPGGQSLMVPWDYDLAWGCNGEPANGETVANWNIDKLYNDITREVYYYSDNLSDYYGGTAKNNYYDDKWNNSGSGYPLFHVIYQNKSLMEKFHTYMEDCSMITSIGGTTSKGNYYEAGRFGAAIDSLYDGMVRAASEKLANNASYLQYDQPNDVKRGLNGLKQIIALRSVGVWLQVNGIKATVTGYGYETGSLGNDAVEAQYTTSGSNLAVVDDTTGIFTIADYGNSQAGPELSAKSLAADSKEYQAAKTLLQQKSSTPKALAVYALSDTKKATSNYDVYLPVSSKNAVVYSYSADNGTLTPLNAVDCGDCTKKVTVSELSYLAVADECYQAGFSVDEGVKSIDVYYTQDYTMPSETNVKNTIARSGLTGTADVSGERQINFKVNLKNGYKIKSVRADKNYKNIKTPAETAGAGIYRVTKIQGDLAVTVETVQAAEYEAVFEKGEGVESIDVYYAQDASKPDETNVEKTAVRSKTGEVDMTGEGQVNFKVNLKDGYMVKEITISDGYFKNIKLPAETGIENVYRVTKILGDVKITVTTQEYTSQYEAAFVTDEGVSSIDIYYTQDYTSASEKGVTKAYARDSATGKPDTSGAGQINFKVNLKDGYAVQSVTADANYNNIKGKEETLVDNVYRITKITGHLNVTITTEKKQTSGNTDNPTATDKPDSSAGTDKPDDSTGSGQPDTDTSITCSKTVYKVAYGAKAFKISASSNGKLTFTSSKPKIASVDRNTGKVTIKGTGIAAITIQSETDTVKVTVKVSPKKPKVKSAKAAKGRKLTVKWAKDKNATGYQVQVSTSKKFKKIAKQKTATKTSCTLAKLKAGKKYYVRIRSYKKSGSTKLYSAWSSAKKSNKVKK